MTVSPGTLESRLGATIGPDAMTDRRPGTRTRPGHPGSAAPRRLTLLPPTVAELWREVSTIQKPEPVDLVVPAAPRAWADRLGTDAERYAAAATRAGRAPHPERYRARTLDNPLYRAELAHARLCRALAQASSFGVRTAAGAEAGLDAGLTNPATADIQRLVADYPAFAARGNYSVTRHLAGLSTLVVAWLETSQLWPPTPGASPTAEHETRCAVAQAARIVILSSLTSLGVTAPERI